jgi:thiol:disulfide interchange protein
MKYLSIITIVVALIGSSFVWAPDNNEEAGIQFENLSFEEAIQKAKKENKLIFLDAYAVWCGPCKMMDRTTFKDEEVGKVFNKNFINLKIDMEKGEGPAIARKYQVRAYPTMMLINGDGKVEKRILGAVADTRLLDEVKDFVK